MEELRFVIKNYHAIQEADITLGGVTVLSGENGCGKSTISRWMYYILNGIQDFERVEASLLIDKLNTSIRRLSRIFPLGTEQRNKYNLAKIEQAGFSLDEVAQQYKQIISNIEKNIIEGYFNNETPRLMKRRIILELSLDTSEGLLADPIQKQIEDYFSGIIIELEEEINNTKEHLSHHTIENLITQLEEEYVVDDPFPDNASFYENDCRLIQNNQFEDTLSLHQAIYVDTAMMPFDEGRVLFPSLSDRLQNILCKSQPGKVPNPEILRQITEIIDGTVELREENYGNSHLEYRRHDGLKIPIAKAATGTKSFAILFRLIACGIIDSETLLIIDEPESHLHPQWVVEYARLLVMINKVIGTRVVLASHDPDMVAAIQAVSRQEGREKHTHFYLAEQATKNNTTGIEYPIHQYTFRDLGFEIGDIFNSFNIAIDRIEQYGS